MRRMNLVIAVLIAVAPQLAFAHGDMTPQAVDTSGLPDLGDDWATENPFRGAGPELKGLAIGIGEKGYNSNCARCHGLEAISGGLAPDLRFLEASDWGDEWYVERFRNGYTQNGVTKMPTFDGLLSQEAGWAIRTYLETRPDLDQLDEVEPRRVELRDAIVAAGADAEALGSIANELITLASAIESLSGAKTVDTPMSRAALLLAADPSNATKAVDVLSDGLD